MGDRVAALRNLNKAVENGWQDGERLRRDRDLGNLYGTPGWEALMALFGEQV